MTNLSVHKSTMSTWEDGEERGTVTAWMALLPVSCLHKPFFFFFYRIRTDLLNGQLQQLWQAGGQHPNEEGCGGAADVQHTGWQHRHKRVLPGERVQKCQCCMATPRQDTDETPLSTKTLVGSHTDQMTQGLQSPHFSADVVTLYQWSWSDLISSFLFHIYLKLRNKTINY